MESSMAKSARKTGLCNLELRSNARKAVMVQGIDHLQGVLQGKKLAIPQISTIHSMYLNVNYHQ